MSDGRRSRPKTALVHDWLTGMRGGEKVLEGIARQYPGSPIYTLFHFPGTVSDELESHPIETSWLQRLPGLRSHYRRYLPLFPAAIESFDLSGYDLVVSTSHCVAKGVVTPPGCRHICYCHTPMRYAWDQEHAYFPNRKGPVARLRGAILSRLRVWDVASAGRVDRYIANSNFVATRIRRYYGRDSEVLAPPVDTDYFTPDEPGSTRGDFCLLVGGLAPYKRADLAIEACRLAGRELVVVGDGPGRARRARRAGDGVRYVGRVEAARLRELYRTAACFLQPGVEDFGISTVEALACGCPVVALGRGGVVDIVRPGIDGVLYDGGDDPAVVAAAIDKARGMRFNSLDLRERAETFAAPRFENRLAAHLSREIWD